jgi:hypothetical protein
VKETITFPPLESLGVDSLSSFENFSRENHEIIEHFYKVNIAVACIAEDNLRLGINPGNLVKEFVQRNYLW